MQVYQNEMFALKSLVTPGLHVIAAYMYEIFQVIFSASCVLQKIKACSTKYNLHLSMNCSWADLYTYETHFYMNHEYSYLAAINAACYWTS